MSIAAITPSLLPASSAGASGSGGVGFAAAMSAATMNAAAGQAGSAATSTAANPFSQVGTDLHSFLVQLGSSSGEAKDISATTASANSTAGLQGHAHGHHHGGKANEGSGDLATDFVNNAIN